MLLYTQYGYKTSIELRNNKSTKASIICVKESTKASIELKTERKKTNTVTQITKDSTELRIDGVQKLAYYTNYKS